MDAMTALKTIQSEMLNTDATKKNIIVGIGFSASGRPMLNFSLAEPMFFESIESLVEHLSVHSTS